MIGGLDNLRQTDLLSISIVTARCSVSHDASDHFESLPAGVDVNLMTVFENVCEPRRLNEYRSLLRQSQRQRRSG